jgi:opacity protein-like surface antigen
MTRTFFVAAAIAALSVAAPVAAQTSAPPRPPAAQAAPTAGGKYFIAATAAAVAVQDVTSGVAGELGMHLNKQLDVFGELSWMQDVATRRRIDLASLVASSLQASQGKPSSGDVEASAVYGGAGIRYLFKTNGRIRPYVTGGAGGARIALKPAFVVGGADVTANLTQYGVTLGRDLTGETTQAAYTGGFGIQLQQGRWYGDLSLRVISIQTEGQATNVKRAGGGIGVRF